MNNNTQTYTILHADHPGGKDDFKVFNNEPAAKKGWKDLMNSAVDAAVEHGRSFVLREYTVELPEGLDVNSIDAKALVEDKSATESRWTRIRPPTNFSKIIKTTGPNVVTEAVIEKAQKVIDAKAEEFPEWARDDVIEIEETLQRILIGIDTGSEDLPKIKDDLYHRYYVLRGQGGTFGFKMVTTGCAMSCQLLDGLNTLRASDVEALSVILDGIKLMLRQPELKDNDDVCNALTEGFSEVIAKALNKKN